MTILKSQVQAAVQVQAASAKKIKLPRPCVIDIDPNFKNGHGLPQVWPLNDLEDMPGLVEYAELNGESALVSSKAGGILNAIDDDATNALKRDKYVTVGKDGQQIVVL